MFAAGFKILIHAANTLMLNSITRIPVFRSMLLFVFALHEFYNRAFEVFLFFLGSENKIKRPAKLITDLLFIPI